MSYDYRDDNDDDNDRKESYPESNDEYMDDKDQYPVDDDHDKSRTGKRDDSRKGDEKDYNDDFFKDEDFEFSDYSGDDVEEEGYRSKRIREKRKRRKLIYTSFTVFIIIVIIAAVIVFGYRYIKNRFFTPAEITEEERITVPESLELGEDINIIMACAGEDLNEPDVNSIMFTSYYSISDETRSLCMPVNTFMDIPGIGPELIGRSVEIGGMDLLSLTLEKGLGMDIVIDHHILMDVKSIVGKLGGIELSLDQAYAVKNYTDGTIFSLEPGVNLLDGDETQNILKFFSGIEKDVPIEDIKIQKKIIDTIIARIVGDSEEDLTNNVNLIKDYIDSDLSLEELLKLFSTFSKIEAGKNMVYTIGISSKTELDGGRTVYLPDVANLSNLFNKDETQEEEVTEAERTINIIILNGVWTPGIAGELRDILNVQVYESGKNKFNVPSRDEGGIGNTDSKYEFTEIIIYSSDESVVMNAANELKEIIGVGNLKTNEDELANSDIMIILGADYDPTSVQDVVPVEVEGIVEIVVLNGAGINKIAAKVSKILEDHFNVDREIIEVAEPRDADNHNYTKTEIIIHTDNEAIEAFAQQIQERLGIGVIIKSDNNIDDVDITVLVGKDYASQ